MKIEHHDLSFEFPDDLWAEAGMAGYIARTQSYVFSPDAEVFVVKIADVGPVDPIRRHKLFRDRASVLDILQGFRLGTAMPPVEVVLAKPAYGHQYRLTNGTHRLYCSMAAGFTHIPSVQGFDINDLTA